MFFLYLGFRDCTDGDDEENCKECTNGAFHCAAEKRCINERKRCDGRVDCVDESDENNCSCEGIMLNIHILIYVIIIECESHPYKMYMCSSANRCYRNEEVCSPHSQCPKGGIQDALYCAVKMNQAQFLF